MKSILTLLRELGKIYFQKNVDFSIIDAFEKVTDKDAALYTRKMALEEGIFAGNSCGAAIKGLLQLKRHFKPDDIVVVLLHDSGSRYIGKMYNDDWMQRKKIYRLRIHPYNHNQTVNLSTIFP